MMGKCLYCGRRAWKGHYKICHIYAMVQKKQRLASGERESRPFREEPETLIYILIITTVLHLDMFGLCTQHRV